MGRGAVPLAVKLKKGFKSPKISIIVMAPPFIAGGSDYTSIYRDEPITVVIIGMGKTYLDGKRQKVEHALI